MEFKPKRIFIDCDETICRTPLQQTYHQGGRDYTLAEPISDNIEKANQLYRQGHQITYWTARGTATGIDWYSETKQQLDRWGVLYHRLLMGKPNFDLLIDDKTLNSIHHWPDNQIVDKVLMLPAGN